MTNLKTVGIGGVVALVVAVGFSYFAPTSTERIVEKVVEKVTLGAFPGPDITSDFLCVNGVCTYHRSGSCADATTSLVSILNPARATTTLYIDKLSGFSGTSSLAMVMGTSTNSTTGLFEFPSSAWSTTTISTSTGYFRQGPGPGYNGAGGVPTPEMLRATTSPNTLVGPDDYLHIKATGTNIISQTNGASDSLLNANNTFTCDYSLRFVR